MDNVSSKRDWYENDVLKMNKPVYTVRRIIEETGGLFGDGTHIIYVNSQIQDESALGMLMRDFHCRKPDEMHYEALSEQTGYYKEREGKVNMCKIVEDLVREEREEGLEEGRAVGREEGRAVGREEGREEGCAKNKVETAIKMLHKKFSFEDIAEISGLSMDEVRELAEKHTA